MAGAKGDFRYVIQPGEGWGRALANAGIPDPFSDAMVEAVRLYNHDNIPDGVPNVGQTVYVPPKEVLYMIKPEHVLPVVYAPESASESMPAPRRKPEVTTAALPKKAIDAAAKATEGCEIINTHETSAREIFMTFDDGPNKNTERTLDILAQHGAKATFFVQGQHVSNPRYHETIRRMHREGHDIAVHTWDHTYYREQDSATIHHDLERTADEIERLTGERPTMSRPPGGWQSERAQTVVASLGLATVDWSADSRDSSPDAAGNLPGRDQVLANLLKASKPGAILLMHEGKEASVQALPELIDRLQADGYALKPLSEGTKLSGVHLDGCDYIGRPDTVGNKRRMENERDHNH